jgi:hypothetical protein
MRMVLDSKCAGRDAAVAGSHWTGSRSGSHQIEHIGGMTGQGQTKVSHGCSKLGNATLETMPKTFKPSTDAACQGFRWVTMQHGNVFLPNVFG